MYNKLLKTSGSPVFFLQDILYRDKDLPEGAIAYLLNIDEQYRTTLHMVLCKYHNVFPGALPTRAPPNRKLGDVHEILLIEGAEPIWKSMY